MHFIEVVGNRFVVGIHPAILPIDINTCKIRTWAVHVLLENLIREDFSDHGGVFVAIGKLDVLDAVVVLVHLNGVELDAQRILLVVRAVRAIALVANATGVKRYTIDANRIGVNIGFGGFVGI